MSVKSSSSSNDSYFPLSTYCYFTKPASLVFTAFSITTIVLLFPLCVVILYLGLQRWRQQCSTTTAAMTSHSDSFTYHLVAMELIGVLGGILCCCGLHSNHVNIFHAGLYLWSFTWYGETFFHVLTCVERYLAVVHPITYLSLRRERGIRIRSISIGCVWLLCFGGTSLISLENVTLNMNFCLVIFSLIIISFCSLSVLFILIRPGPGEQGGDRETIHQSKKRAFYTVLAILGVLLFRCVWNLLMFIFHLLGGNIECVMMSSGIWFDLPCSLVLPLLFLHRAGRLACCKKNTT